MSEREPPTLNYEAKSDKGDESSRGRDFIWGIIAAVLFLWWTFLIAVTKA